jgi:predicted RNA-binding protein with RPS1 domain
MTLQNTLTDLQGQIVEGEVVRLEEYGAFIEVTLEEDEESPVKATGLCHVSEISAQFIENIYAHLAVGDTLEVKVLEVKDDGKVDLSIKQADPDWREEETPRLRSQIDKDFNRKLRRFMHKSQMIQGAARRQRRSKLGM